MVHCAVTMTKPGVRIVPKKLVLFFTMAMDGHAPWLPSRMQPFNYFGADLGGRASCSSLTMYSERPVRPLIVHRLPKGSVKLHNIS